MTLMAVQDEPETIHDEVETDPDGETTEKRVQE